MSYFTDIGTYVPLIEKSFGMRAPEVIDFVKGNLPRMRNAFLLTREKQECRLFDQHLGQEKGIFCSLKVRALIGQMQVLLYQPIAEGFHKNVQKVTVLEGPREWPNPIYVYAKHFMEDMYHRIVQIEAKLDLILREGGFSFDLREELSACEQSFQEIQKEIIDEATISWQVPGAVRQTPVYHRRNPKKIKGVFMEYVRGVELEYFNKRRYGERCEVVLYLCEALGKMHREGIVHLDLKEDNFLITRKGIRLIDFGLSRKVGDSLDRGVGPYTHVDFNLKVHPSMDMPSVGRLITFCFYGKREANHIYEEIYERGERGPISRIEFENFMRKTLGEYPEIDSIIENLYDLDPLSRWTAEQVADRLRRIEA